MIPSIPYLFFFSPSLFHDQPISSTPPWYAPSQLVCLFSQKFLNNFFCFYTILNLRRVMYITTYVLSPETINFFRDTFNKVCEGLPMGRSRGDLPHARAASYNSGMCKLLNQPISHLHEKSFPLIIPGGCMEWNCWGSQKGPKSKQSTLKRFFLKICLKIHSNIQGCSSSDMDTSSGKTEEKSGSCTLD